MANVPITLSVLRKLCYQRLHANTSAFSAWLTAYAPGRAVSVIDGLRPHEPGTRKMKAPCIFMKNGSTGKTWAGTGQQSFNVVAQCELAAQEQGVGDAYLWEDAESTFTDIVEAQLYAAFANTAAPIASHSVTFNHELWPLIVISFNVSWNVPLLINQNQQYQIAFTA